MFHLPNFIHDKESMALNVVLYLMVAVLAALVFSYVLLAVRVSLESGKVNEIDSTLSQINSPQRREQENKALAYKKKIDAYGQLVESHAISSPVFNFIEEKTLSNVWFSNFEISTTANNLKLSGEAEHIQTLARQVAAFESDRRYFEKVNVLSSEADPTGKIRFVLNFNIKPWE